MSLRSEELDTFSSFHPKRKILELVACLQAVRFLLFAMCSRFLGFVKRLRDCITW